MKLSKSKGSLYFSLFSARLRKYGGHSQWIAAVLGNRFDYFIISLHLSPKDWLLGYISGYYDGMHHCIYLGLVCFSWGGWPDD